MKSLNLKDLFTEWVEPDIAHYYLACILGIMPYDNSQDFWIQVKGVFNTSNPVSNLLFRMLEEAVDAKLLMKNDDLQYRWNPEFEQNFNWKE